MPQELIYTSAPEGLKPGSRGFCTVQSTRGMAAPLAMTLESLSAYRPVFPSGSPESVDNPVSWSYSIVKTGAKANRILSRVADYGLDYSERSNKLAHHLVVEPSELCAAGPAWVLSQPGTMVKEWDGKVRLIDNPRSIPNGDRPPQVCRHWESVTGDAGWAGVLAEAFLADPNRQVYLIIPTPFDLLPLFEEAIALLPRERRWDVTFSTYLTTIQPNTTCLWRGHVAGSKEANESRRYVKALRLDFTTFHSRATGGELVDLARTGRASTPPPLQTTKQIPPPVPPSVEDSTDETESSVYALATAPTVDEDGPTGQTTVELPAGVPPPVKPTTKRDHTTRLDVPPPRETRSNSGAPWVFIGVAALLLVMLGSAATVGVLYMNGWNQSVANENGSDNDKDKPNTQTDTVIAQNDSTSSSGDPEKKDYEDFLDNFPNATEDKQDDGKPSEKNGDKGKNGDKTPPRMEGNGEPKEGKKPDAGASKNGGAKETDGKKNGGKGKNGNKNRRPEVLQPLYIAEPLPRKKGALEPITLSGTLPEVSKEKWNTIEVSVVSNKKSLFGNVIEIEDLESPIKKIKFRRSEEKKYLGAAELHSGSLLRDYEPHFQWTFDTNKPVERAILQIALFRFTADVEAPGPIYFSLHKPFQTTEIAFSERFEPENSDHWMFSLFVEKERTNDEQELVERTRQLLRTDPITVKHNNKTYVLQSHQMKEVGHFRWETESKGEKLLPIDSLILRFYQGRIFFDSTPSTKSLAQGVKESEREFRVSTEVEAFFNRYRLLADDFKKVIRNPNLFLTDKELESVQLPTDNLKVGDFRTRVTRYKMRINEEEKEKFERKYDDARKLALKWLEDAKQLTRLKRLHEEAKIVAGRIYYTVELNNGRKLEVDLLRIGK